MHSGAIWSQILVLNIMHMRLNVVFSIGRSKLINTEFFCLFLMQFLVLIIQELFLKLSQCCLLSLPCSQTWTNLLKQTEVRHFCCAQIIAGPPRGQTFTCGGVGRKCEGAKQWSFRGTIRAVVRLLVRIFFPICLQDWSALFFFMQCVDVKGISLMRKKRNNCFCHIKRT